MNLTSKRIIQTLSACACAVAFVASAGTTWVADTFEEVPVDTPAGEYKTHVWDSNGYGAWMTNLVWDAKDGDASSIQPVSESGSSYAGTRPITNVNAQVQALKLETEGQTLRRYVNFSEGSDFMGTTVSNTTSLAISPGVPVYVDTLMKFTPSEDDPDIVDNQIQFALWVNAESNLVVRCGHWTLGGIEPTNSVFTNVGVIDPEKWYRVTAELKCGEDVDGELEWLTIFRLYLDGTVITNDESFEFVPSLGLQPGEWFFSVATFNRDLEEIAFQGTGWVDDLVVTDELQSQLGVPSGAQFTLSWSGPGILSVVYDGTTLSSSPETGLTPGLVLTVNLADWYTASLAGATWNPNGTVDANSGATATITTSLKDDDAISTDIGPGYPPGSGSKIAQWAMDNAVSEADFATFAADYLDDYLLNVAPGTDARPIITSIVVDNGTGVATITVEATEPDDVDFWNLNGTLTIWTVDNLGDPWGEPQVIDFVIDPDGTQADPKKVTITVEEVAGRFIKAVVK